MCEVLRVEFPETAMARSRIVEAPAKNDVYFGMWLVALIATAVAVLLLCLELTEYGWENKPAAAQAVTLPAIPVREVKTPTAKIEIGELPKRDIVKSEDTPAIIPPIVGEPLPLPPIVTAEKPPEAKEPKPITPTPPASASATTPKVEKPVGPSPGGFELPKRK
jgi:hypothetical protein